MSTAQSVAGRNLNLYEWQQFFDDPSYRRTFDGLPVNPSLLEPGRELARNGNIEAAITKIKAVLKADGIDDKQANEEAQFIAHVEYGIALASDGKPAEAAKQIVMSANIKSVGMYDSIERAWRRAKDKIEWRGVDLRREERFADALKLYNDAERAHVRLRIEPYLWSYLCWDGCLNGNADLVLPAGEIAVEREPENLSFVDTRGIARALTGDVQGAITDFETVVEMKDRYQDLWTKADLADTSIDGVVQQRTNWLQSLRAGKPVEDVFTAEVFKNLRKK
jgi:tetratricopeptide (TPR) repeat protein